MPDQVPLQGIVLYRGAHENYRFRVTGIDTVAAAEWHSGASAAATTRYLTLTLGNGVTTSPGDGYLNVDLAFTDAQTEALEPGYGWHELWLTDLAGKRKLVARGQLIVFNTLATVP